MIIKKAKTAALTALHGLPARCSRRVGRGEQPAEEDGDDAVAGVPDDLDPYAVNEAYNNMPRAARLAAHGELSRARRALEAKPILDPGDSATADIIRGKFPPALVDPPQLPGAGAAGAGDAGGDDDDEDGAGLGDDPLSPISPEELEVTRGLISRPAPKVVDAYLRSRSKMCGAGNSGLTFDDLKAAVCGHAIATLHLCKLLHDIMRGLVPPAYRDALTASRGVPLDKGDGTPRPIGILEVIVRLAAGLLAREYMGDITKAVGPFEFGFGVSGGAEAMSHVVRALTVDHPEYTVVHGDTQNAFNELEIHGPHGMLQAVAKAVPQLLPYALFMYGTPTTVTFQHRDGGGSLVITRNRGVLQGDPLGGIFYSITLAPTLAELRKEFAFPRTAEPGSPMRDADVLSLYDDVVMLPRPDVAPAMYKRFKAGLAKHGLTDSGAKGEYYSPAGTPPQLVAAMKAAGLSKPPAPNGLVVAGAAIGTEQFMRAHCDEVASKIVSQLNVITAALADRLRPLSLGDLPVKQGIFMVLRVCEASRFIFTLRVHPPDTVRSAAQRVDAALENATAALLGVDVAAPPQDFSVPLFRSALHLALRNGGGGVMPQAAVAEAAYVGAVTGAAPHILRTVPAMTPVAPQVAAPPAAPGANGGAGPTAGMHGGGHRQGRGRSNRRASCAPAPSAPPDLPDPPLPPPV